MLIPFLISKIHRATVTETDLNYYGSIAIDEALMKKANLLENQKVEIYNITNGSRFSTYVITGKKGSGEIVLNGAAAHLVSKGDLIIIAAYAVFTLFAFVTLPVEFDASNRALAWIDENGIVSSQEHEGAKDALKWAAMTYLVAAIASLVTLLYYIMAFLGSRD